ncbi:unnamed protein product [Meloidogyne enterolobii]|uniref:Uncharacterized protein n=1 Tax=Meloidogyne enterolobii TaxID=390850 RepID=A0ACB0ZI38_MELEN
MYPMKPYNEGIVVKPAKIVYEVSSYHTNSSTKTSTNNIENQMSKLEIKKSEIMPKESTKKFEKSVIPRLVPPLFFCSPDHFELFCLAYNFQYIIRKSCSS